MVWRALSRTLRTILRVLFLILWICGALLAAAVYVYSILIGESRRVANKRNCK